MARWEPGTAARLQQAALELFASQGYEQTTAADIAAAAGVSERTFFRHFGDKRDVVFHGQDGFLQAFLDGAAATPADAPPMTIVRASLRSVAELFDDERRPFSRLRQAVVDGDPALQERERAKLATIADALTRVMCDRGVPELAARLAAESGATVFAAAFAQWHRESEQRPFDAVVDDVLDQLTTVTSGRQT